MNTKEMVTVDDLIQAYLRFKDWICEEIERSAYSAKEMLIMQELFGTSYVKFPAGLPTESYADVCAFMKNRDDVHARFMVALYFPENGQLDALLEEELRLGFISEVHYFMPISQAIMQTAASVRPDNETGNPIFDEEIMEDQFQETDEATVETIRRFVIAEHPEIEFMTFPREKLYAMGLPRTTPDAICQVLN